MRLILIISFMLLVIPVQAQKDTLNQIIDGKRQGYWIITGEMNPDKGYCSTCKVEEGLFVDDEYHGIWIRYHLDGITPRLVITFDHGKPHGPYKKINDKGIMLESGDIRGLEQIVHEGYYPCGKLHYLKSRNEDLVEHGNQYYYFKSCDCPDPSMNLLQKIEVKENGVLVDTSYTFYRNGCLKAMIIYRDSGKVAMSQYHPDTCTVDINSVYMNCLPSPEQKKPQKETHTKPAFQIKPNGYNIIPWDNYRPYMIGHFKNGNLHEGHKFSYDKKGELKRIEVYVDGKWNYDAIEGELPPVEFTNLKGKQKLFGVNNQIWIEAVFKKGVLWKGEVYYYNVEGKVYRIDLWKKGKFQRSRFVYQ